MRQLAFRLPLDLIEKLDAKVAKLNAEDRLRRAERSTLVRVLIEEAIAAREKKGHW